MAVYRVVSKNWTFLKIVSYCRGVLQEQKKAASEKKAALAALTKGQGESAPKTKEMASPSSESNESKRKLSVGACVSSVRVDYESFEVGTGQVSVC